MALAAYFQLSSEIPALLNILSGALGNVCLATCNKGVREPARYKGEGPLIQKRKTPSTKKQWRIKYC